MNRKHWSKDQRASFTRDLFNVRARWPGGGRCVPSPMSNKQRRRETALPEFTKITNRRVQFQSPPRVMCYTLISLPGNAHTSQPLWVKFDSLNFNLVPQTSFSMIFLALVQTCILLLNMFVWKACCTAPIGSILMIKYQEFLGVI